MNQQSTYRPDIDGLRAIAVLSVLLFHLDIAVFSGGFIGVDIFFVISGFLITRIIVTEVKNTGNFSFSNFYLRRFRRLFPALLAVLAVTITIASFLFAPHDLSNFGASTFHAIFSISNIYFWREAGYFDPGVKLNPVLHTWSLSVEEQFYLVWPLTVLFFVTRFGSSALIKVLVFVIISSLLLNLSFDQKIVLYFFPDTTSQNLESIRAAMFYLGPFRNFELGLGALLVFFMHKKIKSNALKEIIFLIGLAMIIVPVFLFTEEITFPSYNALIPCVGVVMVIFANNPRYSGALLSNKFFVKIGLISYSLYLVHWPLIVFYKYWTFSELNLVEQIILGLLSLVLSLFLYEFVEQRWRKPLNPNSQVTMPNSYFVAIASSVSVFFIIATANMWANDGWTWRLNSEKREIFSKIDNPRQFHLKYYGGVNCKPYKFCSVNSDQKRNVFFVGDSHSQQYAYGLAKLFPNLKFTHIDNRCRFSSIDYCNSGRFQESQYVADKVKEFESLRKSNDFIIIGQHWGYKPSYFNTKTKKQIKIKSVEQHVDFLVSEILKTGEYLGKERILIMGQVNRFGNVGSPLSCLGRPILSSACKISKMTHAPRFNNLFKAELEKHGIEFINPTDVMCDFENKTCLNINDKGLPLYSDSGHLSIWGSEYLVAKVQAQLERFLKMKN